MPFLRLLGSQDDLWRADVENGKRLERDKLRDGKAVG